VFVCHDCGKTFEDHESHAVLENPADSNSRLVRVCGADAKRRSNASCTTLLGFLAFVVAIVLVLHWSC
jgi:hypothetical protein